jgi:hypothetical protein
MPGSCSSNALNGCANCGPALTLWVISTFTSQSKVGFTCLNGESSNNRYASKSSSGGRSSHNTDNFICENVGSSRSYSSFESYSYKVDKFGIIAIGINANTNGTLTFDGSVGCEEPEDVSGTDNYFYQSIAKKNSCEEDYVTSAGDFGGMPGILYCPPPSAGAGDCNNNISCTTSTSNSSAQSSSSFQDYYSNSSLNKNIKTSLNDVKNLQFFYGLCQSSVSTKIGILEANQPQNCVGTTCGEDKDACWGLFYPFSIADNNLDDPNAMSTTAQKLKFKISTPEEGFDKTYKSVSGKVKLYIPSEQDIEEGRTPCCNDDFSGTVVKETGYSISAGGIFKQYYFAANAGDFDNNDQSHVGQTIVACATIDNVSFI